jgi:integrase
MTLTDSGVAALKPTPGKQVDYPDAKVPGLAIRVSPGGTKTWLLRYMAPTGERRRMKLGTYPALKLADARSRALKSRAVVEDDRDPVAEKAQAQAQSASLNDLAEEYWGAAAKGLHGGRGKPKRQRSIDVERQRYEAHAAPEIGKKPYSRLTRGDIRELQRKLTDKGLSPHTVAGVLGAVRGILGLAVHEERIAANPAAGVIRTTSLPKRERYWTPEQARTLYAAFACEDSELEPSTRLLLRFLALTLLRRDEARLATWAEVDADARTLTVPAARMKGGKAHVVPLSGEAWSVLQQAKRHFGSKGGLIFPSARLRPGEKERQPLFKDVPYVALRRACTRLDVPGGGPHDWRRTAATTMTGEALGIRRFIVSLLLAHTAEEGAAVTGLYDLNAYLPERRRALDAWAAFITRASAENVIALRGEAANG